MFDIQESGDVFDSWIDRWRAFRGIDQWPIVNGEVVNTEYINSGESGYYKLTLKYRAPGLEAEVLPITSIVVLDSDRGAKIGEIIRLRAHPSNR
jgi:hypothetical protein